MYYSDAGAWGQRSSRRAGGDDFRRSKSAVRVHADLASGLWPPGRRKVLEESMTDSRLASAGKRTSCSARSGRRRSFTPSAPNLFPHYVPQLQQRAPENAAVYRRNFHPCYCATAARMATWTRSLSRLAFQRGDVADQNRSTTSLSVVDLPANHSLADRDNVNARGAC